ncbi:MAG TPA: exonuclease domain-containing protein, partial [Ignavibacteriaceae bacterium]|nr:exonuclease domain-containing protein [Ignavibacteriaceae bacterium]
MISDDLSNISFDEAEFSVLDVETTGLTPRYNGIIEIGIVKVKGLEIVDRYSTLINPGRQIPYYITQFTGITDDDTFNSPFFEEVAEDITKFISGSVITAHNLSFDRSFINKEFLMIGQEKPANPQLCTLRLSKKLYPDLRSRSLANLSDHLGVRLINAHRALPDAEATAQILIRMLKYLKRQNEIKTVSDLLSLQVIPTQKETKIKISKHLKEDVYSLPEAPGIYYFLNSKGRVIYIGKAKSLSKRVRSYFLLTSPRKAKRIIKQTKRIKYEITNSELTALLSEAELIKLINPKHNLQLKHYGNKYFLRVNKNHNFPDIEISNRFDFDGNDYFGLFISKKKAEIIYEVIKKAFTLRECSNIEFQKNKRCFLAEIERCTAPCETKDAEIYNDELNKAYEFLYGQNQNILNRLLNKMKLYSEKQKYEKAGEVKQLVDLVLSQTHKTSILKEPVNSANVLFEVTEKFGCDYILMTEGKIYIKEYKVNASGFDTALDDYYSGTIHTKP